MNNRIELPVFKSTSPSLSELMRLCLLRAGLSRANAAQGYALGNPRAWLGTAFHYVLERTSARAFENADEAVDSLWAEAVGQAHERAMESALDRRFGPPDRWPGFWVTRASASLHARAVLQHSAARVSERLLREQEFFAFEGRLRGRPDVVKGEAIIDYKTGSVVELDDSGAPAHPKDSYVRQLNIYSFLVWSNLGYWPSRGILLPALGAQIEVPLSPESSRRDAFAAVELLDRYLQALTNSPPDELAAPSEGACRWCDYKVLCGPYWSADRTQWTDQVWKAAVHGVVQSVDRLANGGTALSIGRNERDSTARVGPLWEAHLLTMPAIAVGDLVRITDLRQRPDGMFSPGPRTVLFATRGLPPVVVSATT